MLQPYFRLTALAVALASSSASFAVSVYDNGGPSGAPGTGLSEFRVADNFTLSAASNITNLRFWSVQDSAADYLGSLAWAIYSDVSNAPGATLFSAVATPTAVAAGTSVLMTPQFVFDIPVTFTLAAGNYWLGLNNNPLNSTNPKNMVWATTATGDMTAGKYLETTGWVDTGNEHAFRIDGVAAVPEASTAAMFLAGLAACAALRKKRQATTA
jgi:hypothetical protein